MCEEPLGASHIDRIHARRRGVIYILFVCVCVCVRVRLQACACVWLMFMCVCSSPLLSCCYLRVIASLAAPLALTCA
jgi:hypothetical protein